MKNPPNFLTRRKFLETASILGLSYLLLPQNSHAKSGVTGHEIVDIAPVWAGHPVSFALLTKKRQQFVAYYDDQRQMIVAQRTLGSAVWTCKKLPTSVEWDSHNSIAMALDADDCLHISGNMHAVPLVYFRASKPLDVDSIETLNRMTGDNETHVTYPRFFYGPSGDLIYSYRDGRSGDGNNLLNVYDPKSRTWRRLLDTPLMVGMTGSNETMNAYMLGPDKGPDGIYHVSWVWRNTPDASTCHDLSYIRSKDLVHWETIDGKPVTLPITLATPGVVVDPIPVKGGILNGMGRVGFDGDGRVILSYAKFDANGKTQLYLARYENGAWQHHLASDWDERVEFNGGGSLVPEIHIGTVEHRKGRLEIAVMRQGQSALWEIDRKTMKLAGKLPSHPIDTAFAKYGKVESSFPGMEARWSNDSGHATDGMTYRLRWETLPQHRDKPRDLPWPPPSMLRVIGVRTA